MQNLCQIEAVDSIEQRIHQDYPVDYWTSLYAEKDAFPKGVAANGVTPDGRDVFKGLKVEKSGDVQYKVQVLTDSTVEDVWLRMSKTGPGYTLTKTIQPLPPGLAEIRRKNVASRQGLNLQGLVDSTGVVPSVKTKQPSKNTSTPNTSKPPKKAFFRRGQSTRN